MRTTTAATNPWGDNIDDGWKDIVVSSAPPPPPRDAMIEPVVRNRPMPSDINAWQEHGAARAAAVEAPVEEPNFTAGDRRLWLIAGTLMGLAVLVLGILGTLTFGGGLSSAPAAEAPRAAAATVGEPHRAVEPSARATTAVAAKSSNPRILKAASHSSKGRHHKRLATR
ncbi:MAG TPA: hypothetical protein VGH63_08135 [Polyangia bacterium]